MRITHGLYKMSAAELLEYTGRLAAQVTSKRKEKPVRRKPLTTKEEEILRRALEHRAERGYVDRKALA